MSDYCATCWYEKVALPSERHLDVFLSHEKWVCESCGHEERVVIGIQQNLFESKSKIKRKNYKNIAQAVF